MNTRILAVCHANRCRSVMLETLLKRELERQRVLDVVVVESAGLLMSSPQWATDMTIAVMKEIKLDVSGHRSRYVGLAGDPNLFDLVLCMGYVQCGQLRAIGFKPEIIKIVNGLSFGVSDPTLTGLIQDHRDCRELLAREATRIVAELTKPQLEAQSAQPVASAPTPSP